VTSLIQKPQTIGNGTVKNYVTLIEVISCIKQSNKAVSRVTEHGGLVTMTACIGRSVPWYHSGRDLGTG